MKINSFNIVVTETILQSFALALCNVLYYYIAKVRIIFRFSKLFVLKLIPCLVKGS